jgi:hypothetical protein
MKSNVGRQRLPTPHRYFAVETREELRYLNADTGEKRA